MLPDRGLTLEGQVVHLETLMRAPVGRDDRSVADQGVVDTRIGDQVGLELVEVDIERAIEPQGRGDGADDLGNQAVQVLVARAGDVQVATADVVDSLVVDEEGAVGVLDRAVGRQDGIVGLNDGGRHAGGRVDGELQLALLAVLGGQALEQEGTETGASTTTKGVEDQETLETAAVVCTSVSPNHPSTHWRANTRTGSLSAALRASHSPATRRMRSITLSTISLPMV